MKILMCVPNISEGRNQTTIEAVVDTIRTAGGVKLTDYSSDADHNRSVITYLGEPQAVLAATEKLALKALELIDMTTHHGSHPRQGAVDVVPFIPIRGVETQEAIEIARRFGHFIGEQGVPVYYYEDAATRPERVSLVAVRKGQYESLATKLKDPQWKPDEGPAAFNAKSGSMQVAARFPLVALNVNLRTTDLNLAQTIAKGVRHLNGGYRYVRAIGLSLEKEQMVQVSMNLTNYLKTPIPRVLETIRSEAARYGVNVVESELVGPVPLGALEEVARHYLQAHHFSMEQIIENSLIE